MPTPVIEELSIKDLILVYRQAALMARTLRVISHGAEHPDELATECLSIIEEDDFFKTH